MIGVSLGEKEEHEIGKEREASESPEPCKERPEIPEPSVFRVEVHITLSVLAKWEEPVPEALPPGRDLGVFCKGILLLGCTFPLTTPRRCAILAGVEENLTFAMEKFV